MLLCGFFSAKTQSFCGFENGDMCGFTQETETDHFDWTRTKGDTPSGDTGPAGDHTCGGVKGAGKQRAVGLGHGYSRTSLCSKPTECQWIWTMMLLGEFYKYFIGKSEFQYLRSILNRTLQISSNIFLTSTKLYPVFFKTIITKDIQRPGVYYNNLSRIKGPIHPVIWLLHWPSSLHVSGCSWCRRWAGVNGDQSIGLMPPPSDVWSCYPLYTFGLSPEELSSLYNLLHLDMQPSMSMLCNFLSEDKLIQFHLQKCFYFRYTSIYHDFHVKRNENRAILSGATKMCLFRNGVNRLSFQY